MTVDRHGMSHRPKGGVGAGQYDGKTDVGGDDDLDNTPSPLPAWHESLPGERNDHERLQAYLDYSPVMAEEGEWDANRWTDAMMTGLPERIVIDDPGFTEELKRRVRAQALVPARELKRLGLDDAPNPPVEVGGREWDGLIRDDDVEERIRAAKNLLYSNENPSSGSGGQWEILASDPSPRVRILAASDPRLPAELARRMAERDMDVPTLAALADNQKDDGETIRLILAREDPYLTSIALPYASDEAKIGCASSANMRVRLETARTAGPLPAKAISLLGVDDSPTVRQELACRTDLDEGTCGRLLQDADMRVRAELIRHHPPATDDAVRSLYSADRTYVDALGRERDARDLLASACPPRILARLMVDGRREWAGRALEYALASGMLTSEDWRKVSGRMSRPLRLRLAKHRSTPHEVRMLLADDSDPTVADAARSRL